MSEAAHRVRALAPLVALLGSARVDVSTEARAQRDLQRLLEGDGGVLDIPGVTGWDREYRLTAQDRPDFRVLTVDGDILIEVKKARAREADTLRQLARYAAHPDVVAIVLASAKAMTVPAQIGGKPVAYVGLGRAWL